MIEQLPAIVAILSLSENQNDKSLSQVIDAALGAWFDGHAEFFLQTACSNLRGQQSWVMARPSLN